MIGIVSWQPPQPQDTWLRLFLKHLHLHHENLALVRVHMSAQFDVVPHVVLQSLRIADILAFNAGWLYSVQWFHQWYRMVNERRSERVSQFQSRRATSRRAISVA